MVYDFRVDESQAWVNANYTGVPGYVPVAETGLTGWPTMFALTRALQHELGLPWLSDAFGPTTLAQLTLIYGDIDVTINYGATPADVRIIRIIQCAMWCKGYASSVPGVWDPSMDSAIAMIRSETGLPTIASPSIPPKLFKSLLTMDAYSVYGSNGTSEIRAVQRWLNGRYLDRKNFFLLPCDGNFSRDVQKGLVYAIQYEIGLDDYVANGAFGPATQQGIRDYGIFSGGSDSTRAMRRLYQAALILNKMSTPFNGTYDAATNTSSRAFQSFAYLPLTNASNFGTWASLLVSTGDPSRAGTAADMSTPLTGPKATSLYSAGYRTVGRYLNGTNKRFQPGEFATIFDAQLTMYLIYQEYNNELEYFTYAKGYEQGLAAVLRARAFAIKSGAVIYFAVDYDATSDEIAAVVIPYFQGVRDGVATSVGTTYQVGVYGTRNVCAKVSAQGLAMSSFIAGMSTGWSGNLGFTLPTNWAYDQIQGLTVGSGSGAVAIDKNIKRLTAPVVNEDGINRTPINTSGTNKSYDEASYWRWTALQLAADNTRSSLVSVHAMNDIMLMKLQMPEFWGTSPVGLFWKNFYTPPIWDRSGTSLEVVEAMESSFDAFAGLAGNSDFPLPEAGRLGQLDHFAATTRGQLAWGVPSAGTPSGVPDLGGWATDLVRAWVTYEEQRLASPTGVLVGSTGGALGVREWMELNIGIEESSEFGPSDFKADLAGYLCASELDDPYSTRTLSDVIRQLFVEIDDDPGYLATEFVARRFGSRAAMVVAAKNVFTQIWPVNLGIDYFLTGRAPGATGSSNDPVLSVRQTELQDLAEGFADAVENAQ